MDPAWQEIANELAGALRPYSLFREQTVEGGRVRVHTCVPGATLTAASRALDRLAAQVRLESHRRAGMAPGIADGEQRDARPAA